jgi:hypothetical protein
MERERKTMRAKTPEEAAAVMKRFMPPAESFRGAAPTTNRGSNGLPAPPAHLRNPNGSS